MFARFRRTATVVCRARGNAAGPVTIKPLPWARMFSVKKKQPNEMHVVFREDINGNTFQVDKLPKEEAEKRADHLNSLGHHQFYWSQEAGTAPLFGSSGRPVITIS